MRSITLFVEDYGHEEFITAWIERFSLSRNLGPCRDKALVVRFLPSGYHPLLRVSQDLSERQPRILLVLGQAADWTFALRLDCPGQPFRGPRALWRMRSIHTVSPTMEKRMR